MKIDISHLFHSMLRAVHLLHHMGGGGVSQMLTLWDRGVGGGLKNYDA